MGSTEKGISMKCFKNNDGFTMVELIVSMAITAIVITMLAMIISAVVTSSRNASNEATLQKEAQFAINQLAEIIMEAKEITGGSAVAPDKKYLIRGAESRYYAVFLKADEKCLYLMQTSDPVQADGFNPALDEDAKNKYLLAEYVESISIETSPGLATINIKFVLGESSLTGQKNIAMRNR